MAYGEDRWATLVGKKVTGLLIGEREHTLVLTSEDGPVVIDIEGDCCSECWFADITGVERLIGHTIQAVANVDMPAPDDTRTRREEDRAYGLRLRTDAGYVDIVYRNSSNGYYGGWAFIGETLPEGTRPITEDWSA